MYQTEDSGFWPTVAKYAVFGAVAAVAIDTLTRGRRPRDVMDGVFRAVNVSLDSEAALSDARVNSELFMLLAPAVAAAGLVLAIQIGRQIGAQQK